MALSTDRRHVFPERLAQEAAVSSQESGGSFPHPAGPTAPVPGSAVPEPAEYMVQPA